MDTKFLNHELERGSSPVLPNEIIEHIMTAYLDQEFYTVLNGDNHNIWSYKGAVETFLEVFPTSIDFHNLLRQVTLNHRLVLAEVKTDLEALDNEIVFLYGRYSSVAEADEMRKKIVGKREEFRLRARNYRKALKAMNKANVRYHEPSYWRALKAIAARMGLKGPYQLAGPCIAVSK